MEIQVKLFQLYQEDFDLSISRLLNVFSKEDIVVFKDDIIGIKYDYRLNKLEKVIDKVNNLNLNISEVILTSNRMDKLISLVNNENIILRRIEVSDHCCEDAYQIINKYISEIQYGNLDKINNLLFELTWLNDEEEVFIEKVELILVQNNVQESFTLYEDGVILISQNSLKWVLEILHSIV